MGNYPFVASLVLVTLLSSFGCDDSAKSKTIAESRAADKKGAPEQTAAEDKPTHSPAPKLSHPEDDPGTKLLQEFRSEDIVSVAAEMGLGSLLAKPREETKKMLTEARQELEKLNAQSDTTTLDQAGILIDVLSKPHVQTVIIKMSKSGSEKLGRLKELLGEPTEAGEGVVPVTTKDTNTGDTIDAELPVTWQQWSWAAVAVHEKTKIAAIRLDAEQWRKTAKK